MGSFGFGLGVGLSQISYGNLANTNTLHRWVGSAEFAFTLNKMGILGRVIHHDRSYP